MVLPPINFYLFFRSLLVPGWIGDREKLCSIGMSQNKKSRSRFGRNTWLSDQPAHCFLLFVWKAILDSVQHFLSVTLDVTLLLSSSISLLRSPLISLLWSPLISHLLLSSASLSVIGDGAAADLTTVCCLSLRSPCVVCLFDRSTIKSRSVSQSCQRMGCKVVFLFREREVSLSQSLPP